MTRAPSPGRLARILRQIFAKQKAELSLWARHASPHSPIPDMSRWTQVMVDLLLPVVVEMYRYGGKQAAKRITHAARSAGTHRHARVGQKKGVDGVHGLTGAGHYRGVGQVGGIWSGHEKAGAGRFPRYPAWLVRKASGVRAGRTIAVSGNRLSAFNKDVRRDERGKPQFDFEFAWDIYRPESLEFIRQRVYEFCASTNATARTDLETAIDELRIELSQGVAVGSPQVVMNRRVGEIFGDAQRAARISQVETSRAIHAGQYMAAKESGVASRKIWVYSGDACKLCLKIGDRGEIPFDEPFAVLGIGQFSAWPVKNPAYQIVQFPPAHVG